MLTGNALGHGHTLFFSFVCQHGATHDVAHRPHIGQIGLAVVVHHNGATLIQFQAHAFGIQAIGIGHAANRHDQLVAFQLLSLALGIGVRHRHALLGGFDVADLHTQLQLQALFGEDLLRLLGHLLVNSCQEGGQSFQHGDLRPEAAPNRAHFQANHTRADHAQLGRHLANGQGAIVGQHQLFIERHTGQLARIRARGHHNVLAN